MNAEDVTSMVKMDLITLLMIDVLSFFNQIKEKCQLGSAAWPLHFSSVPFIFNLRDGFFF